MKNSLCPKLRRIVNINNIPIGRMIDTVTTEVISRFSDIRKVSEKTLFRFNKLKEKVYITCKRNSFQILGWKTFI
jgi:hypothetical protein